MAKEKRKLKLPPLRTIILRDSRSAWDGHVCKVLAGPYLERSVSPGEIAVFEPTGETAPHVEVHKLRGKTVEKTVEALVYRRIRTRLLEPFETRRSEEPVVKLG